MKDEDRSRSSCKLDKDEDRATRKLLGMVNMRIERATAIKHEKDEDRASRKRSCMRNMRIEPVESGHA
jgi:hypothetical protein